MSDPTLPVTERPWSEPGDQVSAALGVDRAHGLSADEVRQRLEAYGPNQLRVTPPRSAWSVLVSQFRGLLVVLLAGAAVLSAAFGQWSEALAVAIVLLLNAAIGFVTELRAVRSVEALRKLGAAHATVRRDGRLQTVEAVDLVPGDVLLIEGGDVVAADARIVRASRLQADESTLTGESMPVEKSAEPVAENAGLPDRLSMLYKGTAVSRGSGEALVVGTGMATELGRISKLVSEAKSEATPLEERLDGLARRLVWVTLAVAVLVTATGLGSGKSWLVLLQTAIALAVATVPEGLPIIATLTLARGVRRMAERNALVNRLSAVETLGATSIIFTDKTGTLTENRMSVHTWWLAQGRIRLDPASPDGYSIGGTALDEGAGAAMAHALQAAALCGTAALAPAPDDERDRETVAPTPPPSTETDDDETADVGDPMELALLRAARARGWERDELLDSFPEIRQEAFDSEVRMMATVHRMPDGRVWRLVKGAPGAVVNACTRVLAGNDGMTEALDDDDRERWLERNRRLAAEGLRVLALAEHVGGDPNDPPYEDLTLIGMVGLSDPPREDVKSAIAACQSAGIRVVMVTGDQPVTARNISAAVGMTGGDSEVVTGVVMDELFDAGQEGRERLANTDIVARVSPEQKLRLIELHQDRGAIVAMTGDGVNDAPALRRADIGVAMGRRGTEVAREAADMVLKDDAFATIVAAVREGRVIFENIRAFVLYLLSCNVSEILVIGLAAAVGYPLPLLPLQILFLNLVTDVFPALALGAGEGDANILGRPPRDPREPILAARHWRTIGGYAVLLTASVLGAFVLALEVFDMPPEVAVTVSFLSLALAQIWHVANMREPGTPLLRNEITRNPFVWAATIGCTLLVLLVVFVPPLRSVLNVVVLDARGWALTIGAAALPTVLGQIGKALGLGKIA
ncbi:MAG: cation-transporting P-type ATPase [Trueperaceae bacterium]